MGNAFKKLLDCLAGTTTARVYTHYERNARPTILLAVCVSQQCITHHQLCIVPVVHRHVSSLVCHELCIRQKKEELYPALAGGWSVSRPTLSGWGSRRGPRRGYSVPECTSIITCNSPVSSQQLTHTVAPGLQPTFRASNERELLLLSDCQTVVVVARAGLS
eukprot:6591591-Pyramimonas_sp.AAC.2